MSKENTWIFNISSLILLFKQTFYPESRLIRSGTVAAVMCDMSTHYTYTQNAELTSPFRACCHEKRFQFCFVLANTVEDMNKTQANRTQTAATAVPGYMGDSLAPYALDSPAQPRDKTPLIMALSTALTTLTGIT